MAGRTVEWLSQRAKRAAERDEKVKRALGRGQGKESTPMALLRIFSIFFTIVVIVYTVDHAHHINKVGLLDEEGHYLHEEL